MKTGLIIGKFLPFHLGHMHLIDHALLSVDKLAIIVSYDSRFNATLPNSLRFLTTSQYRSEAIREYLAAEIDEANTIGRVRILTVDESNIPKYPDGWSEFTKLCNDKLEKINFVPNYIFTSEAKDVENYQKHFPSAELILCDPERNSVKISGEQIRNKIKEFGEIYSFFEKYLPFESVDLILDDTITYSRQ